MAKPVPALEPGICQICGTCENTLSWRSKQDTVLATVCKECHANGSTALERSQDLRVAIICMTTQERQPIFGKLIDRNMKMAVASANDEGLTAIPIFVAWPEKATLGQLRNSLLTQAQARGATHVMWLDDDDMLCERTLNVLFERLKLDDIGTGVCAPHAWMLDVNTRRYRHYNNGHKRSLLCAIFPIHRGSPTFPNINHGADEEWTMLISREAKISKIGLAEEFGHIWISHDYNMSNRVIDEGLKVDTSPGMLAVLKEWQELVQR